MCNLSSPSIPDSLSLEHAVVVQWVTATDRGETCPEDGCHGTKNGAGSVIGRPQGRCHTGGRSAHQVGLIRSMASDGVQTPSQSLRILICTNPQTAWGNCFTQCFLTKYFRGKAFSSLHLPADGVRGDETLKSLSMVTPLAPFVSICIHFGGQCSLYSHTL